MDSDKISVADLKTELQDLEALIQNSEKDTYQTRNLITKLSFLVGEEEGLLLASMKQANLWPELEMGGPKDSEDAGKKIRLDQYLKLLSGEEQNREGFEEVNMREFIQMAALQDKGAGKNWNLEDVYQAFKKAGMSVSIPNATEFAAELRIIAKTILAYGKAFLKLATSKS